MAMILVEKVRLKPSEEQVIQLRKSVETDRFIFNYTLRMQQINARFGGQLMRNNDIRKHITKMKRRPKYEWLNEVSNNVAKQAVKDACMAYEKVVNGHLETFPFKTPENAIQSFYNDNLKLRMYEEYVKIEKVGWIEMEGHISKSSRYTNPRVRFEEGNWYFSVGVTHFEMEEEEE